ncbi:MAG: hypothetical protein KUG65_03630 [Sphingomonadaceae bacterium]|nr:hypothetical protein [Sphingomonadaceae bacterium]
MIRLANSAKDYLMRFTPAALALSLLAGVTSSIAYSKSGDELSQRAARLLSHGHAEIAEGRVNSAIDAYEAALVVQPGSASVLVSLAEATRAQDMQGKALHYYREALDSDPRNLMAIAGEGAALAEKGALNKARRSLARLKGMCGTDCDATQKLAAVLAKEPTPQVVRAEAVKPDAVVSEN